MKQGFSSKSSLSTRAGNHNAFCCFLELIVSYRYHDDDQELSIHTIPIPAAAEMPVWGFIILFSRMARRAHS